MSNPAHWSDYAMEQMVKFAGLDSPTAWTTLSARLYVGNADPDSGTTPVELTVAGYAAISVTSHLHVDLGAQTIDNNTEWDWTGIAAATVGGVAITENTGHHILWYCTLPTPVTTLTDGGLIVPPHDFIISIVGV